MPDFHQLRVPHLGEGIHHVKVVRLLKDIGEWVEEDSDIVEVETDKATYEVPSPVSGHVSRILCQKDDKLNVGDILLEIGDPPENVTRLDVFALKQKRKGDIVREHSSQTEKTAAPALPDKQIELAERLQDSAGIVIPATIERPFDWDKIQAIRDQWKAKGDLRKVPSSLEVIVKAVSEAMFAFEKFRAKLSPDLTITISEDSLIGIAVAQPEDTLDTVAVKITRQSSFEETRDLVKTTVRSCKTNTSSASRYHSLAISDMTAYGITRGEPVVVYPAIGTLLIGAPTYAVNQTGTPYRSSLFTLSFDHRLMNGAYAARFLKQIDKNLTTIYKEGLK